MDLDPEKSLKSQLTEKEGGTGVGPPLKEDPKYEKYYKMMLLGLHKEVAKHAMARDQLDPRYVFCDVLANFDSPFGYQCRHIISNTL